MPIRIEDARDESVRVQNELIALIPEDNKAPNTLPKPGEVKRTAIACDTNGLYRYPGGSMVRINEGADVQAEVDRLRNYLRDHGWTEQSVPTASQPDRIMQRNDEGFEAIISSIDRPDDLPMVTIDVWSPCAQVPTGVNMYSEKF